MKMLGICLKRWPLPVLAAVIFCSLACRREAEAPAPDAGDETVLQVGDSVLTHHDVIMRIPPGLEEADSAAMYRNIVHAWLERMLLYDIARNNVADMEAIDRMVEDYRRRLVIAAYRAKMRNTRSTDIADDTLRKYYAAHRGELLLDHPVLKGLYVKLPANAHRMADAKRWMQTATPDAIDNLERYGLNEAVEYSFFEDKWTDWQILRRQIPYRFENPDEFLKSTRDFETTYGGMTYLLHVSEYLPSGEIMPYETAVPLMRERLEDSQADRDDRKLLRTLCEKARKEGKIKGNYAPFVAL